MWMSWLGLFQVTKFGTCVSSQGYQKWELLVSEGVLEALAAAREQTVLVLSFAGWQMLHRVFWGWRRTQGVFFARKDDFQTPVLMAAPSLSPFSPTQVPPLHRLQSTPSR